MISSKRMTKDEVLERQRQLYKPEKRHARWEAQKAREQQAHMAKMRAANPLLAEANLADEVAKYFADPLGFVKFAYPWGEPGILSKETGPDDWQAALLARIGEQVMAGIREKEPRTIREAVASGHGVGKSALLCWLIQWFMSTRAHCRVVVTANTENQLNTKTWPELAKWHHLLINKSWFTWTKTVYQNVNFPEQWFAAAIPWTEERAEAFAGTHARDVLMVFDEASAIPDLIWENADGGMTTPGSMFFAFGNMTRAIGRFVDCFERFSHRWGNTHVDSRTAKKANQRQIKEWIEDYGEDSDFVRIRVKGTKPRSGSKQFISHESVAECHKYTAVDYTHAAKVMSVDVARSGECESVSGCRQGRKLYPQRCYRERDSMRLAGIIADDIKYWRPQVCFIEGAGLGGPIVDRLRQLGYGDIVMEVNPGTRLSTAESDYYNHRTKWWALMRDWLYAGAELPEDPELDKQLTMVQYDFNKTTTQLQLERKEDMAYSPDRADQLALTFCGGVVVGSFKDAAPLELPVLGCV